jgi:hypothetical protein
MGKLPAAQGSWYDTDVNIYCSHPGMGSCCSQLGNSTVEFLPDCYSWCVLDEVVSGANPPSLSTTFSRCLENFDSSRNVAGTLCKSAQAGQQPTTTTSTSTTASGTQSPASQPAVTSPSAAERGGGQANGLSAVLVAAVLVGGLVSSGALLVSQ